MYIALCMRACKSSLNVYDTTNIDIGRRTSASADQNSDHPRIVAALKRISK